MAKIPADVALSTKLEILKNSKALSKGSQYASAQFNISCGCLQNLLHDKAALQNKALLFCAKQKEKAVLWQEPKSGRKAVEMV